MRLTDRLARLERTANTEPMLTICVEGAPTPEQQATIDQCRKTGRRLLVFAEPGNTAWMPGYGVPPWEVDHAQH